MIWVASLATAAGLGVVFFSLVPVYRRPPTLTALEDRMAFYATSRDTAAVDELERQSFRERILDPIGASIARQVTRLAPQAYVERLDGSLAAADHPYSLSAPSFLLVRTLFSMLGIALGASIGIFSGDALVGILAALLAALAAWWLAGYWLSTAIAARRRRTLQALPNVVDFLVVAVDAGLNFDLAMNRVVEKYHNPLTDGIARAISQVQLGAHRLEALEEFARRSDVAEVTAFVQTVVTSERMGVPIARTLRIQAADLRWRRGEWARERASRAAIRMTLPMVILIFPTLWLILLGPSFLALLSRGL